MEGLFVLAFSGLMVGLAMFALKVERDRARRLQVLWGEVADKLEGELVAPEEGLLFKVLRPQIYVTVDGVDVHVDTVERGSGKNKTTYTRLRARSTAPGQVTLKVFQEHLFSGIAKALGFQDVEVGDESFDAGFVVKANDPMFARAWLNPTVQKRVARTSSYTFELKRGRASAEQQGIDDDPESLVRAIRALAAFADGKHHVVRAFKKLAAKLGGKAVKKREGWARLTAEVDGIPVSVDTAEHGATHYNVVSATVVGARLTPIALTNDVHEFSPNLPVVETDRAPEGYSVWTYDRERGTAQLTDDIIAQIEKLQPIKVRIEEERVQVFMVGICPPLARMQRMVTLAVAIAVGAQTGPYR